MWPILRGAAAVFKCLSRLRGRAESPPLVKTHPFSSACERREGHRGQQVRCGIEIYVFIFFHYEVMTNMHQTFVRELK